jgi:diacylglycerol kinase family enzyme
MGRIVDQTVATKQGRVFVVLNPVAGTSAPTDVRQTLETLFTEHRRQCSVYETSGDDDALTAKLEQARQEGYDLVVAAGGDGTVSLVANNLVGSDIPLGILPVGTANVLALELGIPQTLEQVAALFIGEHQVRELDVMRL